MSTYLCTRCSKSGLRTDSLHTCTPTLQGALPTIDPNAHLRQRDANAKMRNLIEGTEPSAMDTQVGGAHYKGMKIQPMEYSMSNRLNACQHTAIKYVSRYKDKGDPIENLEKAIHTIQMLIEFEKKGVR